jgi:TolB-like protein/DNA-binding winged helix-turn-helix (wHTH) protein/Flp pilus assembly protein TadD
MAAPAPTSEVLRFGVFELDLQRAELRKQGVKIKLQEQPFKVLQLLLENQGQIVTREQLRSHVWPANTFVEFDHGLYSAMARLRDALGDSSESPRFIETVARRGYRFIAPVTSSVAPDAVENISQTKAEQRAPALQRWVASLLAGLLGGALLLTIVFALDISGVREWLRNRTTPIRSIAVLPLENLSHDPEQEYFADGMTDELMTNLAMVGKVSVISRTSTMQYKGTKKSLPQIGRELHVDAIVEGSVIRSGNRVRITAQLIQATNDHHLWAKDYERDLGDILTLQNELVHAIVSEIKVQLTASERARLASARVVNPLAYDLYLQGRYFSAAQPQTDAVGKAVRYFQQALEIDPGDAPTWAGLGDAYAHQAGTGGYLPEEDGWRKAREAVDRSLALDPNLAEAHAALAGIQMAHDWDWQAAETSLHRALALAPNNAIVLQNEAGLAGIQGQFEQAVALDRRAITLDPLSASARAELAYLSYASGRFHEAAAAVYETLGLAPDADGMHTLLVLIDLEQGRAQEALAEAQQEPNRIFQLQGLTLAYHSLGRKKESDAALEELIAKAQSGGAFQIAEVYGFLADADQACKWLERAYLQHDSGLPFMKQDRAFAKLSGDPRYVALLKKIALAS